MFPAFPIGMRQEFDFDALTHLLPVFGLEQRGFELAQLRFGRADDVLRVALAQMLDVLFADHAAIHHPKSVWPDRIFLP